MQQGSNLDHDSSVSVNNTSALDQTEQNTSASFQSNSTNTEGNTELEKQNSSEDDPTKNMTKAEKKVYEMRKKLELAEAELQQEKEIEKQRNTDEIVKLISKKKLNEIPYQTWKKKISEIESLLNG
jgi:hypothetical protein